jgi:hypothetical protein
MSKIEWTEGVETPAVDCGTDASAKSSIDPLLLLNCCAAPDIAPASHLPVLRRLIRNHSIAGLRTGAGRRVAQRPRAKHRPWQPGFASASSAVPGILALMKKYCPSTRPAAAGETIS